MADSKTEILGIDSSHFFIFVSLFTAGFYINSIAYFEEYFKAIGISYFYLNLPIDFFITKGILSIILTFIFIFIVFFGFLFPQKNRIVTALTNFIFILMAISLFYIAYDLDNFLWKLFFFFSGIFFLFFYLFSVWVNYDGTRIIWEKGITEKILIILLILILTANISMDFGKYQGNQFLKSGSFSNIIEFKFKENTSFLQNESLLLILYHEGNYYIIPTNSTNRTQSKIYIISENQIEYATLKTI